MSNFYLLPLKTSSALTLEAPLQKYLQSQYGSQVAEQYYSEIGIIQNRRNELINAQEKSKTSAELGLMYAAQVEHLNKHFPISSGQGRIKLSFSWTDAFNGKRLSQGNAYYEMANVLYNVAATESHIASAEARKSSSDLVGSAKGFQFAAGLFAFVKNVVCPKIVEKITLDLSNEALEFYEKLMLAHAQQCVLEKSILSNMKGDSIAKLSVACADLYDKAFRLADSGSLKELFSKSWLGYLQGKALYYQGLAYIYLSQFNLDNMDIGHQICHMNKAKQILEDASNCKLPSDLKQAVKDALNELKVKIPKAIEDNKVVYHLPIPSVENATAIEGRQIAKSREIHSLKDVVDVPDAFSKLFPIPVLEARQRFKEEANTLISTANKSAREHRDSIRSELSKMGLPALVLAGNQEGFSEHVHQSLDRVKNAGGINALKQLRTTIAEMSSVSRGMCERLREKLQMEEQEDAEKRANYGYIWNRLPSNQLNVGFYRELENVMIKIEQAAKSDEHVDTKVSQSQALFLLLAKSRKEVDETMPKGTLSNDPVANVRAELGKQLEQLDALLEKELEIERSIQANMEKVEHDISTDLIQTQNNLNGVVETYLEKYRKQLNDYTTLRAEEDALFDSIRAKYTKYRDQLASSGIQRERQAATQNILDLVNRYDEITNNLREGVVFYTAMQDYIKKISQRVEDFVFARQTEMKDLMSNIMHAQSQSIPQGYQPYGQPVYQQPQYGQVYMQPPPPQFPPRK